MMTNDTAIVTELNRRAAECMRVFGINAREAILQVANSSTSGLRRQDMTNPEDTDGQEIHLYALPNTVLCVNAWLVSPHDDAAAITDPDAFLASSVGFDNQRLDWGWRKDEDDGETWL